MKKIITLMAVAVIFFSVPAWCQTGTATVTALFQKNTTTVFVAWIADASGDVVVTIDATTAGLDLAKETYGLMCINAETVPGLPAPTALYDIAITDAHGYSVFGVGLANRSATVAEVATPEFVAGADKIYGGFPIRNTWTVTISSAGNGGSGTLEIVFQ